MKHERHYSVEQANAALGWVGERLDRLRAAHERLTDEEARAALGAAAPTNGGGAPGLVVSDGFLALQSALRELQEMEILLRDLDRGLVDFPALREGRQVLLCWRVGEESVAYWHGVDEGFAGRKPLEGG